MHQISPAEGLSLSLSLLPAIPVRPWRHVNSETHQPQQLNCSETPTELAWMPRGPGTRGVMEGRGQKQGKKDNGWEKKNLLPQVAHKKPLRVEVHKWQNREAFFLIPTTWWEGGEHIMTGKIILVPPYMGVTPPQTEGRWTIPSPLYRRGSRSSRGQCPSVQTRLGLFCEHTSARGSLNPNHLVTIASASLDDSEGPRPQHIQNQPQGFLPPKPSSTCR